MSTSQNEQRPTPETDALAFRVGKNAIHPTTMVVALNDARDLERQRDEAREQLEAMREAIKGAQVELAYAVASNTASVMKNNISAALAKLQPFIKL